MIRVNRQKHCKKELRGAIVGQWMGGMKYGQIAQSLDVSVTHSLEVKVFEISVNL